MDHWISDLLSETDTDAQTHQYRHMRRMLTVIDRNMDRHDFGVNWLASELAFSRRQFYRLTKNWLGMTPGLIIQEARLRKAHWLIETGRFETVKDVVPELGLRSEHHFVSRYRELFESNETSQIYKRHLNNSPKQVELAEI